MKYKVVITVCLLLVLTNVMAVFYINRKVEKIVVVDVIRIFNEFELKKDLEKKVNARLIEVKNKIDSLESFTQRANTEHDKVRFDHYRQMLSQAQEELQQATEVSAKTINEQVWKRLNPLIDEFGKNNDYRLVIGANGMGTVLYNEAATDKTAELIQFINEKYEKGS